MRLTGEILHFDTTPYKGKNGEVKQSVLTVSERGEGRTMLDNLDLQLREEQAARLPVHTADKLKGHRVTVNVLEMKPSPIGGRLRITQAELLEFDGKALVV
jgi:hypothetical protein